MFREALSEFETVERMQSNTMIILEDDIGYAYLYNGDKQNAKKYFEQYLVLDSKSTKAKRIQEELIKLRQ
jgi:hypothetical protein